MNISRVFSLPLVLALALAVAGGVSAQTPFPLQPYGSGGCGAGRYVPTFHTQGSFPLLGTKDFRFISRNLPGGTGGFLWISGGKANYPIPAFTWWVDPFSGFGLGLVATGAWLNPGTGDVTINLSIPNSPELTWAPLHCQCFFIEEVYPALSYVWTQGMELNFRRTLSQEVVVLHDRDLYRKYVTGAQRGQAVWNANALPGFSYVNTVKCSSGGQDHFMVVVKDNTHGIEFVLVPGGSFRMGDLTNQGGLHHRYELPIHWVHLEPFLLARAEITQARWQAVMKTAPWQGKQYAGPGSAHVANYLSWDDVAKGTGSFCGKLGWRLPSEAEWEYACRAGTTTTYCYGNRDSADSGPPPRTDPGPALALHPHQPGTGASNAFGLHDMAGNVWEWCADRWHDDYGGAPVDGSSREGGSSTYRVFRGGCWDFDTTGCRSADRYREDPSHPGYCCGFRPALSLR